MHNRTFGAIGLAIAMQTTAIAQEVPMTPLRPDQVAFLTLYKELVETNTTLSAGSCTLAAEQIAAHLKAAGYADKDVTLCSIPEHPKEGGLVAVLQGTSNTAKPMLQNFSAILSAWPNPDFTVSLAATKWRSAAPASRRPAPSKDVPTRSGCSRRPERAPAPP